MKLVDRLTPVTPHNAIAMRRNKDPLRLPLYGERVSELVLVGVGWVVAEIHACEVDDGVGGVVEFYPVAFLRVVADVDIVGRTDFIDADRTHMAYGSELSDD